MIDETYVAPATQDSIETRLDVLEKRMDELEKRQHELTGILRDVVTVVKQQSEMIDAVVKP